MPALVCFVRFLFNLAIYPFALTFLIFYRFLQRFGIQPVTHDYRDHLVLITGSGNGLGRELAVAFAKSGASLALWDVDDAGNRETQQQCLTILTNRNPSSRVCIYHVDVTRSLDVKEAAEKVRRELGQVSILVANAGFVSGQSLLNESDFDTERTFSVNSVSPIWLLKSFLPYMLDANRGHVVLVSSVLGVHACHGPVTYVSSKHASVGLSRSLRLDIRAMHPNSRVSVHCICPYLMRTQMFRPMISRVSLKFLLPILSPDYVAAETLAAIEWNRDEVILPYQMKYIGLINEFLIPRWLSERILFQVSTRQPLNFFRKKSDDNQRERRRKPIVTTTKDNMDSVEKSFVCID